MTRGVWFWILLVLGLFFSWWMEYTPPNPYPFKRGVWFLLVFVLLAILGWTVFGGPVK
jgi:hypothetical protein